MNFYIPRDPGASKEFRQPEIKDVQFVLILQMSENFFSEINK